MYLLCSPCPHYTRKQPEGREHFVMMLGGRAARKNAQFEPLRQPLHPILTGVMRESFA
jgi:hypothetical protein